MAPDTKIIITITRTIPWEALEVANPTGKSNQKMEKLVLRMFLEAPVVKIIDDEEAVFGGIEAQNQAKNQSDYHRANAQAIACDVQADSQTKAPVVKIIDDEEAVHENLNETQSTKHRLVEVSREPKAVVGYLKSIEDCGRSCCALESTQEPWPELFPDPDGGKGGDGGNHNVKVLPQEEVPCCGLVYYALVEAVEACVMLNPLPDNSQPDVDVLPDPGGRPKGQNNNPKDLAEA